MAWLRGIVIGCGYFGRFHRDAWGRMADVEIVGVCDHDAAKAAAAAAEFPVATSFTDARLAMAALRPDFVDIATPPDSHLELVSAAAAQGCAILCQKPLAPTQVEAHRLVELAAAAGVRLMVHENFRFQPWHRQIRRLLQAGAVGERLHSLMFRTRTGDGWGPNAYLDRQPYFRTMPRLLIFETGVHLIDTFRFLAGEIQRVYAVLRKLNPVIAGEDCGLVVFEFSSGAIGQWDANRYNEPNYPDPRYTFGEFLVEGDGGSIRLYLDGRLTVQELGRPERNVQYVHERRGFGGDCVYATLRHFIDCLRDGQPFETEGTDYLQTLAVQEAIYDSARYGHPVLVAGGN